MCPTLTVGSFFRHERSTFLFICSTTSNLKNFKPQQLQPQKRVQNEKKKQNRRPEARKHTKDPPKPHFFGLHQRVPFICFDILQHNGCQKIPNGPPFTFFGKVTLFENLIKNFFGNFFMSPKGPPFIFSFIFCNQLEFHKARRVPLFNFEP